MSKPGCLLQDKKLMNKNAHFGKIDQSGFFFLILLTILFFLFFNFCIEVKELGRCGNCENDGSNRCLQSFRDPELND